VDMTFRWNQSRCDILSSKRLNKNNPSATSELKE
jgi:hypothetical protein